MFCQLGVVALGHAFGDAVRLTFCNEWQSHRLPKSIPLQSPFVRGEMVAQTQSLPNLFDKYELLNDLDHIFGEFNLQMQSNPNLLILN